MRKPPRSNMRAAKAWKSARPAGDISARRPNSNLEPAPSKPPSCARRNWKLANPKRCKTSASCLQSATDRFDRNTRSRYLSPLVRKPISFPSPITFPARSCPNPKSTRLPRRKPPNGGGAGQVNDIHCFSVTRAQHHNLGCTGHPDIHAVKGNPIGQSPDVKCAQVCPVARLQLAHRTARAVGHPDVGSVKADAGGRAANWERAENRPVAGPQLGYVPSAVAATVHHPDICAVERRGYRPDPNRKLS